MATYTIQAPDGNSYTVAGPENVSQEDVQAEVARQHPDSSAPPLSASPTPPQAVSATDGMTTGDKVVAGVGKAMVDTYRGAVQLVGTQEAKDNVQQDIKESRKYDAALMATNAGKAGELMGHMVIGVAAPGGLIGQAVAGAAQGALTPTADGESRGQNIAMGAGLGAAGHIAGSLLGKVVGGVMQPFRTEMSEAAQEGVETLTKAGVPLNAAQQGGGRIARSMSSIVEDNPLNGSNLGTQQKKAFTSSVLKILGVQSEDARPAVMQWIRSRIGSTLDQQAEKNPIAMDEPLLQRMATIQASAEATLTKDSYAPIEKQLDNIMSYAAAGGGTINGKLFANLRSELSLMQKGNSGVVGHWAGEVQDAVTDALERQAPKEDMQAIAHARQSWRVMRQVEPGIDADNYINPAKLYNSMDTMSNINQMVRGQGDQTLVKMAQAGKLILGNQQPNSGTAARAVAMLSLGGVLGSVDAMIEGKPSRVWEGALAGLVGPSAMKLASENPASARIIGRWARSKAIASFRAGTKNVMAKAAGTAVGAVVPTADGDNQVNPGEEQQ